MALQLPYIVRDMEPRHPAHEQKLAEKYEACAVMPEETPQNRQEIRSKLAFNELTCTRIIYNWPSL